MAKIRRVVLDILKPHEPGMPAFTTEVGEIPGVTAVNTILIELDREVQNVKLAIDGDDLDVESIEAEIEALGGTIHSIDMVAAGEYVIGEGSDSFMTVEWPTESSD